LAQPYCDAESARFVIVPVPYDKASNPGRGLANGPRAILDASKQIELFDEEMFREWYRVGVTTRYEVNSDQGPEQLADVLEPVVAEILLKGKRPIILGGEHAVCLGAVRAAAGRHQDLTVLHLSAHANLRDSYEGQRFGSASIVRRVIEFAPVVQVGIRSFSFEEADHVDKGDVTTFFMHDIRGMNIRKDLMPQVLETLSPHVYVSLDMSVFEPALVPGVPLPEPGGLDWASVLEILRVVARERDIVGIDCCELMPLEGHYVSEFVAARMLYKVIGCIAQYHQFPEIQAAT
jgi:agmatinase